MKWPPGDLLMQMLSYLATVGARLKLQWHPREENEKAGDIINCRFVRFNPELKVEASLAALPMAIFNFLYTLYAEFDQLRAPQIAGIQVGAGVEETEAGRKDQVVGAMHLPLQCPTPSVGLKTRGTP